MLIINGKRVASNMFILYEMNTHSEVDRSPQEQDIISTIGEFYKENTGYRFMVIEYDTITTEPKLRSVRNIGDYEAYIQEYNARQLRNKTCVELKREIFEIMDGKKPKTR